MMPPAETLDTEHKELDHLLADVEYLAQRRRFMAARLRFDVFRVRLLEHLREEEDVLFPAYVMQNDGGEAVVRRLRDQHAQLETALEAVASALVQCDYNEFCYGLGALGVLLQAHQSTEERLWPRAAADQRAAS